jgi:hypothetical protein
MPGVKSGVYTVVCRFAAPHFEPVFNAVSASVAGVMQGCIVYGAKDVILR